jgi:hypothetical protein
MGGINIKCVGEIMATEIEADALKAKIGDSGLSNSIISGMLAEEINKDTLQTCGMSPVGYFGLYGPKSSITETCLLPNLGEAAVLPKMVRDFGLASGQAAPEPATNFANLLTPSRTT